MAPGYSSFAPSTGQGASSAPSGVNDARPVVLVVEDEVLPRITFTKMLESARIRVIPVSSAEEALEVLTAIPEIQAAIIDVQLSPHGIDGLELTRKVHEAYSIGLVVLSGRAAPDERQLPPGAHFLAKPVHRRTLVHLTHEVISRRLAASQTQAPAESEKMVEAETSAELNLTRRQHEVLSLMVQGRSNEEIAAELGMALNTVKVHLVGINKALGVGSRAEALLVGERHLQSVPRLAPLTLG